GAQLKLNRDSQTPVGSASQLSRFAVATISGMPSSESNATMVNNALLLAKASVIGHRSISGDSISAATSGEQVRFAHARSSRRHANPAVANTSFITPMSGETANVGGVTGFTLPAGKTV